MWRPDGWTHTAPSSSMVSRWSAVEAQPGPNAPMPADRELYMRSNPNDAAPPSNDRSVSGSMKFPVVVFTGSSAYPEVWGSPRMLGAVTSTGRRAWSTPAACRDASIAASETVETTPEAPAASNAAATVSTQRVSFVLFAPNEASAPVIPDASMLHHEHRSAKSAIAPSRAPFWVVTVSLAPVTFDEYVRRSSGRAEDTAPAGPGAGSDQGVVVGSWGSGSGTWAGPEGACRRWSPSPSPS
ncbi:hypothetical protein PRAC110570_11115 [Propionibacterium acidifaciens]